MKRNSAIDFKNAIDKAFTSEPNVKLNPSTMKDAIEYKQSFNEENKLQGGVSDNMTLLDLAKKHAKTKERKKIIQILNFLEKELEKGIKVEREHTKDKSKAKEIAMDHLSEDPKYYQKLSKIENKENYDKSAKKQFAQDLQLDKDFIEFKKRAKFDDRGYSDTFGTPNVTVNDPYIKKPKKWARPGKEETKEATSSGSSGAFAGPIAFQDSEFLRNSFKETPKLKEGLALNAMGLHGIEKAETKEATGSGSVGGYETPSMWAKSTSKKDWGPSRKTQYKGGSFVKVKKKCTKFPYCNQGDINALKLTKNESVKEAILSVSKKLNLDENIIVNILEHEYSLMEKRNKT